MANKHQGDVAFTVDGKTYTLRYSVTALIELEEVLECSIADIGEILKKGFRIEKLIPVFRCGLSRHHPEIDDNAARQIMDDLGFRETVELFNRALSLALGSEEPGRQQQPAEGERRPLAPLPGLPGSKISARGSRSASTPSNSGAARRA